MLIYFENFCFWFVFGWQNQDGLIYADLQLAKSRDSTPVPERKDAVNYDVIDFTRKAPEPGPDDIEVVPDEEPLYANK